MIQLEIFEILIDDSAFPFQIDELNLISQAKFQENFHPFVPSQSIFQKLSSYTVKLSEKAAVSDFNCNKTAGPVSATIKDGDNSLVVQFGIVSIFIVISDYLLSYSVQIVFSLMKFIRHSINLYIKYQVLIFHYEGGGGANGEMANLTNEKGKFAIAIFRHFSPFFAIFRHG